MSTTIVFKIDHYEILNICDPQVKRNVIRQLNLEDHEGDTAVADNFIFNKASFTSKKALERSLNNSTPLEKVNFEELYNNVDEMLYDDYKFTQEFAFLTVKSSSCNNRRPTKSEGVSALKQNRFEVVKRAVMAELKQ